MYEQGSGVRSWHSSLAVAVLSRQSHHETLPLPAKYRRIVNAGFEGSQLRPHCLICAPVLRLVLANSFRAATY